MRQSAKDFERVLEFLQGEDLGQNQRLPPMQASRGKTIWGKLGDSSRRNERKAEITKEHNAILDAIKQRDPDQAASRMREHLRSTRLAIFGES
jgi:DNA-binding FadR family transcriptional regulator